MSLTHLGVEYPCALIDWFSLYGDEPDADTGLWVVTPDFTQDRTPVSSIIHLDCILRAAHLLPVFGDQFLPENFHFSHSLDAFDHFFVNKYIDHHAHENAF